MQDRFKFRFFDVENKKMYDVKNICFVGEPTVTVDYKPVIKKQIYKGYLMQCTGLSDKNGKEIYEGDILDLYVSSKKLYRYEVKYEIGSFMLVSQDEIFDFPNVWNDYVYPLSQLYYEYQNEEDYIYQCEVVGNIYENPELLENN